MKTSGLDTETIDGKCRLICTPTNFSFINSYDDLIHFLKNLRVNEARQFWTFNLRYDTQAMLKWLPYNCLEEIYESNKTKFKDESFFYIPKKLFSISWKGNKISFVDAMQFYGSGSLDSNSEKYLGEKKQTTPIIESFKKKQRIWSTETLENWLNFHKEEMIKYCQRDAWLTQQLGQKIEESQQKIYGLKIETYTSNAKLGELLTINHMRKYHQEYPHDIKQSGIIPEYNLHFMSDSTCRGGWFETWQAGRFDEVTDLDINGAYPFIMAGLPHWYSGQFNQINDISELEEGDYYGWVWCEFDCPYIPFLTNYIEDWYQKIEDTEERVMSKKEAFTIVNPDGKRVQCITLAEFLFMQKNKFKSKLIFGWVWRKLTSYQENTKFVNPFGWIPQFIEKKAELKRTGQKSTLDYLMVKIAPNGTSGKCIQKVGQAVLYSPEYYSYITAETRIRIAQFIIDKKLEKDVINIATDGLLLNKYHNYPSSEDFGEFEVHHYDEGIIVGNGMHQLFQKDGSFSTRARGLDSSYSLDLKSVLQKNRNKDKIYPTRKLRPIQLGEAITHKKLLSLDDLNNFKYVTKSLTCTSDKKRDWDINCFDDILERQYIGRRWHVDDFKDGKNPYSAKII